MRFSACAALAGVGFALQAFATANKYVAGGWEFAGADVETLLARADELDRTPFDGFIVYFEAKGRDGLCLTSRNLIHQRAWDYEEVSSLEARYRKLTSHRSFANSFMNSYRAPTNRVDWTDDASWARIANNMRVIARLAKRSGFAGLQMDPEDYHDQHQYLCRDKKRDGGLAYAELSKKVRARARQVFGPVFEEFPDVKLLSYWFLTMDRKYVLGMDGRHLRKMLESDERDLWPHFVDGIFDVLPPTATLVDGCENGYIYSARRNEYDQAALQARNDLVWLLSPENRVKYRAQMQMSFGVYLDGYCNAPTNSSWYMGPLDGSRFKHLECNVHQATKAAGEFVWFWGENGSWTEEATNWERKMPGLKDTLLSIKDPAAYGKLLRRRLEAGELKPLNANVACVGTDQQKVPLPYGSWQEHPKYGLRRGTFGCDLGMGDGDSCSLVAEGVESGCFTFERDGFRPGERFGLSFASKGRHVSSRINWHTAGRNNWAILGQRIPVSGTVDANGWSHTDWSFVIPEGADGFTITFSVWQDPGEKCWFDNIMIIPAQQEVRQRPFDNGGNPIHPDKAKFIRDVLSANPVRYDSEKMDTHAFDRAFAALAKADRAADVAWEKLKDETSAAAYRALLKEKMTAAVGGFPGKTPLNVQVRGVIARKGYRIEKLLFESRPKHYVTALLFVPDGVDATHRVPGVVVTCGHNANGKNSFNNQRAAVVLAQHGLVALIFDPIDQGERQQLFASDVWSVTGHVNVGLRAHLVGWSTAQFRIWDGIRALDVLLERPEVDAAHVGVTGMSGGGTMSAYLNALDSRYTAASPMGYITTLRALADRNGPQDMEQLIFGQLRDGLNHLSLILMNGNSAIAPGFTYGDLFPYAGSDETYDRAQAFFAREGRADRISRIECDGPHNWYESEKQALAAWFRRWLADDAKAWPPHAEAMERADVGFDYASVDTGLAMTPDTNVLGGKGVMSLSGARSVYDLVDGELDRLEKHRERLSPELVRRTAGISADPHADVLASTRREEDAVAAETAVLRMPDASRVVVRAFFPSATKGSPVFFAADADVSATHVATFLEKGRPVAVVTARGFGETYSHQRPHSYWARKGLGEELSAFFAWSGRNFVAARAEDYLAAGAWFRAKTGRAAEIVADGDAVVAAAHAYYLGHDRFSLFAATNAPASWTKTVRTPAAGHPRFCNLVYGGLSGYDWVDLIP